MPLYPKDDFTLWLEARGTALELYQPGAIYGAVPIGWKVKVGGSSFVYRLPAERPGVLIIVLFERLAPRKGLRSPFSDFVRFLSLIKKSGAAVHTIEGHVEALDGRPADSLVNEQIAAFYSRYLAAGPVREVGGVEWYAGNLLTYEAPLATIREEDSRTHPMPPPARQQPEGEGKVE
ncbi:MAG: hypothetical protein ACAI34_24140 [Verrucomicrobium sp.]|nr:hypothetical protein [Verrucomicrobium sp.]